MIQINNLSENLEKKQIEIVDRLNVISSYFIKLKKQDAALIHFEQLLIDSISLSDSLREVNEALDQILSFNMAGLPNPKLTPLKEVTDLINNFYKRDMGQNKPKELLGFDPFTIHTIRKTSWTTSLGLFDRGIQNEKILITTGNIPTFLRQPFTMHSFILNGHGPAVYASQGRGEGIILTSAEIQAMTKLDNTIFMEDRPIFYRHQRCR